MKKLLTLAFLLTVSCSSVTLQQYGSHDDYVNKIKIKLTEILKSPQLKQTKVGIKIVSLKSKEVIFEQDSEKLFTPASNLKIITALAALKTIRPEYKFKTEVLTDKISNADTVNNVWLKGSGDPSLTFADLNKLAFNISRKIKKINGDIIADASYFDNIPLGQGWLWDDGISDYSAPVSALNINSNCIDIFINAGPKSGDKITAYTVPDTQYANLITNAVTSDKEDITISRESEKYSDKYLLDGEIPLNSKDEKNTCSVSRPSLYAITLFKELLQVYGVKVAGSLKDSKSPSDAVVLEKYESKPLTSVINYFLKNSDNLSGEALLKALGASVKNPPGSSAKGVEVEMSILRQAGVEDNTYRIVDGSGLSRYNLISPSILVKLLEYAYNNFDIYPEFISALPTAGVDGTLRGRMKGNNTQRKVRAKTGTMSGVSCISGYLTTANDDILAVSIMMNGYIGPSSPYTKIQDEIFDTLE